MNAKKKCCWLTAVLIFALAVGLLPATAFAAGSPQVQLNGQAMVSGVEVVCGEGTALFDEAAKTLTLENATIEETTNQNVAALFIQGELTIRLIGNNRIAAQDKRAIYAQNADLTIQGTSADCLTLESNGETLQADQSQVTIDGCVIRASSHRWGGILAYGGTMTIQNGANITIDSQDPALVGENGLTITDSAVTATAGAQVNAVSTYGPLIVRNSTLQVTGLDATAYPAIYAAGDILIEANSTVTSLSNGMRGIYAEANMTVNDSTVTASGATNEGVIVVGTLTVNRSVLTASSKPNDIIPAIVTQHLHITDSRVTANGGLALMDWNNGTTDNCSFSITPGAGELVQFKVDPTNWNGATAVHFDKQGQSPYDTTVDFDDNAMNWLGSYRYVQVDEHVHAGGTATCQSPAGCA
ncbi:hypothetical protein, partial [uncultured Ruthenibacterium sp.]|uniref:hypothetical protein n=1 Tax=uncultured Ruthenibacterium sp. TaxID=1905347 RepID=UPI00349E742E